MSHPRLPDELAHSPLPALPEGGVPQERLVEGIIRVIAVLFVLTVVVVGAAAALVKVDVAVAASGELEPIKVWPVRPPEGGTVRTVAVRAGDHVVAGQLLFVLDSVPLTDDIATLQARIRTEQIERARQELLRPLDRESADDRERLAEVGLRRARANLLGVMADLGKGTNVDSVLSSPASNRNLPLEVARQDVSSAEVQLHLARLEKERLLADSLAPSKDSVAERLAVAQLAAATRRKNQLRIYAPAEGTVLTERADDLVGQIVREGDPVLEIAPLTAWRARLLVAQGDVHRIRVGQIVRLNIDAVERERLPSVDGVVESVSAQPWLPEGVSRPPSGSVPQYAVTVAVSRSAVSQSQALLRRGYTVRARIVISHQSLLRSFGERLFGIPAPHD